MRVVIHFGLVVRKESARGVGGTVCGQSLEVRKTTGIGRSFDFSRRRLPFRWSFDMASMRCSQVEQLCVANARGFKSNVRVGVLYEETSDRQFGNSALLFFTVSPPPFLRSAKDKNLTGVLAVSCWFRGTTSRRSRRAHVLRRCVIPWRRLFLSGWDDRTGR
jgi:hypothetical protein